MNTKEKEKNDIPATIQPEKIMEALDRAIQKVNPDWDIGDELHLINIWLLRSRFMNALIEKYRDDVRQTAYAVIVSQLGQYSETLEKGYVNPSPAKPQPIIETPDTTKSKDDIPSPETPELEKSMPVLNTQDRKLSPDELERFEVLNETVCAAAKMAVEAGMALAEIRDSRLYLATQKSFEAYCQEVRHMTKSNANYRIRASETHNQLTTTVAP